ncbi:MAG: cytochrome BD ubiquinol oxidase subunit II [Betaproteobacteria bacterium]|nr:cytochrome BD ubiquinol oxidase subunit II [Betaproteobacteria bacterium]
MTIDLPFVFMVLMGLAILAYVVLDGFDLGVGILLPFASRPEQDLMVASIGPFWDANETWLVLGVGILLVAFPQAHGIILTQLYLPVAVMLIALILRGVAFEFRVKASGWHQVLWNRLFFVGSTAAAVAQGVMLAGLVTGFGKGPVYWAFGALVGIGLASGYALLGATWLVIKTGDALQRKAMGWARAALLGSALGVATISVASPLASAVIYEKWFSHGRFWLLVPLPILTAIALWSIWRATGLLREGRSQREWLPFVLSVWVFVFAFLGLGYSLYPDLVLNRMTIWQAAAAPESLRFVLAGALVVLPLIVAYTVFSYRVFWGKAQHLSYGGAGEEREHLSPETGGSARDRR